MRKKLLLITIIAIISINFAFTQTTENVSRDNNISNTTKDVSQLELRNSAQMLINPIRDFQNIFNLFINKKNNEKNKLSIASLKRLEQNKTEIQNLAFKMDDSTKNFLYYTNAMAYKGSFAWAITTGFGIGNFIQGDFGFGSLFAAADIGSAILLCTGGVKAVEKALNIDSSGWSASLLFYSILPQYMFVIDMFVSLFTLVNDGPIFPLLQGAASVLFQDEVIDSFLPWAITGATIKITSIVFQCIRAKSRATKYNKTLEEALQMSFGVEKISFAPIINPVEQSLGLAMAINF